MKHNTIHDFAKSLDSHIVAIDLRSVRSKKALLESLATNLKLPPYFGHNWDALADCLTDEHWARQSNYVIVLLNSHTARKRLLSHWEVLLGILGESAEWWWPRGKRFHIILA